MFYSSGNHYACVEHTHYETNTVLARIGSTLPPWIDNMVSGFDLTVKFLPTGLI